MAEVIAEASSATNTNKPASGKHSSSDGVDLLVAQQSFHVLLLGDTDSKKESVWTAWTGCDH